MTAQDQGGGRPREEMPRCPRGEEERGGEGGRARRVRRKRGSERGVGSRGYKWGLQNA